MSNLIRRSFGAPCRSFQLAFGNLNYYIWELVGRDLARGMRAIYQEPRRDSLRVPRLAVQINLSCFLFVKTQSYRQSYCSESCKRDLRFLTEFTVNLRRSPSRWKLGGFESMKNSYSLGQEMEGKKLICTFE